MNKTMFINCLYKTKQYRVVSKNGRVRKKIITDIEANKSACHVIWFISPRGSFYVRRYRLVNIFLITNF